VTLTVYLVATAALAVFVGACTWRVLLFARSPIHLRWELYPVPHESPDRVAHGGSYFEQSEWWKQPRPSHLVSELRFMVPEILFLHALRKHNRPLWYRSFPFHFGLYALAGAAGLLFGSVVAAQLPTGPASDWLADVSKAAGAIGVVSCVAGAAGLLHRRLTDPALRISTTPGDIFNLSFFIGAILLLVAGYAVRPPGAPTAGAILAGLLSWNLSVPIPVTLGLGLIATALLGAYIPLTHMSHFIAKYFTYHAVRWDDEAVAHNAGRARAMAEYLTWHPTWSAPHVRADGSRTWREVVADVQAGSQLPPKSTKESK
jgi:nitrate reductase gamma subunit